MGATCYRAKGTGVATTTIDNSTYIRPLQESKDYKSAAASYTRALAALPTNDMSAIEVQQKQQYEQALVAIQDLIQDQTRSKFEEEEKKAVERLPWEVAHQMLPKLKAAGQNGRKSSAWVVIETHKVIECFYN
jgi:predicted nucleotide-binding protein